MKFLIKTLIWLVLLIALAVGIGRSFVLRYWGERDRFFYTEVVKGLRKTFPNATVELDAVKYDFGSEVALVGFALRPVDAEVSIIQLPKTVIHFDREEFIQRQRFDVAKVVLKSPQLQFVRGRDGTWNWQSLLPLPTQGDVSLPEVAIEDGTVTVRVEQAPGIPAGVLTWEHIDMQLVPSGKRQFHIQAVSNCEQTGQIELSGKWHVDRHTGFLGGQLTEITVGQELVGLVASFAPEARDKLAEWEAKLLSLLSQPSEAPNGSPIRLTPAGPMPPGQLAVGAADSILGLRATMNVQFRMSRPETETTPTFQVALKIRDGQITNPILPFPLNELTGELSANNKFVRVKQLSARNGATVLAIDGQLERTDAGFPGRFQVNVKNMVCDSRLRNRLSAGFGRVYDATHPQGDLDLTCAVVHDGAGHWRPEGLLATAKDCSVIHDVFPYPVEHATGTIRQSEEDAKKFVIDLTGLASGRPITLSGVVTNPGPDSAVTLDIETTDLPLDETFLKACRPELQKVLRQLRLTGTIGGAVRLTKLPRQPFVPRIEASLRDGKMMYELFPWVVTNLSAELSSAGHDYEIKQVTGQHGSAKLKASGRYRYSPNASAVKLHVETQQADLDEPLFQAMPPILKRVWREFSPTGVMDCTTDIAWQTGKPLDIRVPSVELRQGSVTLKSLPYRLDQVSGKFRYGPDDDGLPTVMIDEFQGRHGDMQTQVSGWQRVEADGNWRARLEEFTINKLVPNSELKQSLTQLSGLKQVFDALDPKQSLSVEGIMELRGTPNANDPITAAWELNTTFSGGTIHTGLDFKELRGLVVSRGKLDAERNAEIEGFVELQSAKILDYVLRDIRGPYRVEKGVLMFGAADVQRVRPPDQLDPREQVTAKIFGGLLTLDGLATLTERPKYQVVMNLQNARLEKYAALHMPTYRDLYGETNGWVNLRGVGDSAQSVKGEGQLQVSDAALLDMPVMLEMFRRFSLNPPAPRERSFQYALLNFDLRDSAFQFKEMFLQGDTLNFRGRGYVTFDSDADLNFYSEMPRNQLPIPFVREIIGQATKGWVGVHITGNLDDPRAEVIPVPLVNETVKALLGMRPQPFIPITEGQRKRSTRR